MYCRGHELRVQLCKQYDIKPVGRFKLLNGRTIISDAGNMDITDEYTIFDCISNNDSNRHETIYCGKYVAEDLCKISGYSLPPLFDPLHHDTDNHGGKSSSPAHKRWNKTRKQLYDIVLLLMVYLENIEINSPLFNIKSELENPNYIDHYPKYQIKGVNTIIGNTGKTFQEILDKLNKNNNLRVFNYDLVIKYMEKLNINQNLFK
ncbi:MAG TPA: hypothetical protein H9980_11710 [Candidatus Erysipelatoclostridium merdavium]|uniref:Uncharacterized protein n=1 Tax=Candidatus Erysipelatoclostridium merdavium TaxID=2838566 RepID=A0A9D2BNJ8_9FIRM|nr:hypothetical protein [Candidatus Erysipelatoclostridium merdavium]